MNARPNGSPADPTRAFGQASLASRGPVGYETPIFPVLRPDGLSHPLCIAHNPFLPTDWFRHSLSVSKFLAGSADGDPQPAKRPHRRTRPLAGCPTGSGRDRIRTGGEGEGHRPAPAQTRLPCPPCSGAVTPVSSQPPSGWAHFTPETCPGLCSSASGRPGPGLREQQWQRAGDAQNGLRACICWMGQRGGRDPGLARSDLAEPPLGAASPLHPAGQEPAAALPEPCSSLLL